MSKILKMEVFFSAVDKFSRPIREAGGHTRALYKDINKAREEIKKMESSRKLLENLNDTGRALAVTKHQLKGAMDKVGELRAQMAQTATPTRAMTKALKDAEGQANALRMRHGKLTEQQIRLRESATAAGLATTGLGAQQRELIPKITAANAALEAQKERLDEINQQVGRLRAAREKYDKTIAFRDKVAGAGMAMTGAGAATLAPVALSVREFAKAEDAATQLRVAMMRAGGVVPAEFREINALAERLGNKLPGTTAELQGMMTMLLRQGMSVKAILGGLGEATAYIGVQMKMPYEEAARFAAQLQDATRTTERDMMGLMDVIQKTYYTGVDPAWMLQGFSKLGAGMDIIKMKGLEGVKVLAPFLAMANQAGMTDGGSAGNAFRKVFALGLDKKRVEKGNAELKALGAGFSVDFSDGNGEFGGIDKLFSQLDKLKGLNTQSRNTVLKTIFGDDAETLQVLSLLIDKGKDGYDEMNTKLQSQADLQTRVNTQLGTLKNLWDAASGTFTNFLVRLGEAISPELKAITEWLGAVAEGLSNWAQENPAVAGAIMKTIALVGALAVGLGAVSLAFAAILGPMAAAKLAMSVLGIQVLPMVGAAIKTLSAFFLTNPLGMALTAIAMAALVIWKYWEPIKQFFIDLWAGVTAATSRAVDWFAALPSRFANFGRELMAGLANGITNGLVVAKDAILGAGESVIGWFKDKLGIRSPSRVFAELGGFTMAGLSKGIVADQAGPVRAVANVARQMAAVGVGMGAGAAMASGAIDMRAPLPGAAQGGAAPINITINAAPGMDEQLLARLVAQEIGRIDRARGARARSSLADRE